MKISVVISIKNRTKLFRRSLKLYNKQFLLKKDWELVIVDDMSTEPVLDVLNEFKDINWQYIKMDSHKNDFPIYWGPALSNNIGFKAARGDVVAIAGPEILMNESALELAYSDAMRGKTPYGHILHSSSYFVNQMDTDLTMEELSFDQLFTNKHSRVQDITKNTFYWFFCATKKENIMAINGCDEEFMRGICGDDDDFANRINEYGSEKIHNYQIVGIHQDHSKEDRADPLRRRRDKTWEAARMINTKYLEEWTTKRNKEVIVNKNRDWGSDKLIVGKVANS
jgi:glycosyltransferase involved in cell wall biosynthesis